MKRTMLIAAVLMVGASIPLVNEGASPIRRDLQSVTIEGFPYYATSYYFVEVDIPDLGDGPVLVSRGIGAPGAYQYEHPFQSRHFAPGRIILPVNREWERAVNVRIEHGGVVRYEGVIEYFNPPAKRRAV